LVCAGALLGAAFLMTGHAESQDQPASMQQPTPEQMQEMMAKWIATIDPGPHHKILEHSVGSWTTTTKVWMGGPGSPPIETMGASEIKWILGGRFLLEEHHGKMLMPDKTGQMKPAPYEGLGLLGYDNARNMYEGIWTSTADTHIISMKGGFDPSGKVLRMYGEMDEPMLDIVGRTVKYVTRIIDKDTHVFEVYDLHAGDDYKVFEITYIRKK